MRIVRWHEWEEVERKHERHRPFPIVLICPDGEGFDAFQFFLDRKREEVALKPEIRAWFATAVGKEGKLWRWETKIGMYMDDDAVGLQIFDGVVFRFARDADAVHFKLRWSDES